MTVAQACAFYAANPDVDEAEKTAFLKSQGVSDFVIAQASCTATGMEKTVMDYEKEARSAAKQRSQCYRSIGLRMIRKTNAQLRCGNSVKILTK